MLVTDVNILVYAFRQDSDYHKECRTWLKKVLDNELALGIPAFVLNGLVRICTHPKIFKIPNKLKALFEFTDSILAQKNVVLLYPNNEHWEVFKKISFQGNAKASLIPDAYLAALVIELGGTLVTLDAGFARFQGLKCTKPFSSS